MSKMFQPSTNEDEDRVSAQLRYIEKATKLLQETSEVPGWVATRIQKAAIELRMAVSYAISEKERRSK